MKPSYLKYKTTETETVDISKLILENSIEFNEEKDLDELIDIGGVVEIQQDRAFLSLRRRSGSLRRGRRRCGRNRRCGRAT